MVNNLDVVKKNELIILKEIKRICEKYNLTYFLCGGTCLGAVRHKGFIPWNDDIDIAMPIEDLKKFKIICDKEFNGKFFYQDFETDINYYYPFTKIRMNNTTFITYNSQNHHIHQGFWVDIFPIVKKSKSKFINRTRSALLRFSKTFQMNDFMNGYKPIRDEFGDKKVKMIKFFGSFPTRIGVLFHKFLLSLSMKNPKPGDDLYLVFMNFLDVPPNIYSELIDCIFEDDQFKIPKEYDKYLTTKYGEYMKLPPIEERNTHSAIIIDEKNDYSKYIN